MLFRYIPLSILKDNKRAAVLLSSALFALAHANLFQIPYAFAAGLVFAAVCIMTGSILPSILIHFLNNLLSLAISYGLAGTAFIIIASAITLLSIIAILIMRKAYSEGIKELLRGERIKIERSLIIFGGVSLFLAFTSLLL